MKQETSKKSVIVVLGMHRSGTSLITRSLQVLGVDLGDDLLPPIKDNNETGFWEDMHINYINDVLLINMNSAWDRLTLLDEKIMQSHEFMGIKEAAVSHLEAKIRSAGLFGFKNPRTAILLPFWKAVFQEIDLDERYLIAVRNPLSVANSLFNRDGMPLEVGIMLWVKHMSGVFRHTKGKRRVVVDYDLMLESPSFQIQRIANMLSLPFDELCQQRLDQFEKEFVRLDFRHHTASLDELQCSEFVLVL